ncbi:MAG: uroporphyrinogen decarboxylase family protein [Candidatus Bipolaricaulota bacterium]
MNSKERVLKAVNGEKPDRIPIDLGSTNCTTIARRAYRGLKEEFSVESEDELMMDNFQIVEVDEKILDKLGIDTRSVHGNSPSDVVKERIDDDTYINQFGIKYKQASSGLYYDMVEFPLQDRDIEYLEDYEWPDPYDPDGLPEDLEEKAKSFHEEGEYAIVGDMVESGIFEPCWYLRGLDSFLMDLVNNKEFAHKLLEGMLDYQTKRYEYYLEEVGEYLDIVFVGDDLATSDKTIMSADTYREMVKPYQERYFQSIKNMTDASLLYHSDGNIYDFVDDLIEVGVDILNPIEPGALDEEKLKQNYGERLCFWGGIDTKDVLPNGSPQDVEEEVRNRIDKLGPEGYVVTSVHDIQADTPAENVIKMFETAKSIRI